MKNKIFKKLIAGAATLAMIAQFGFVLPASAEAVTVQPTAATYVDMNNPDTEYSTATELQTAYNKISGGNVGFANDKWGVNRIALIKFDVSSELGEGEQITKAVLSYKASCDGARDRNHIVGSTKKDWTETATYTSVGTVSFVQIGGDHKLTKGASKANITQDVTDYAKAQTDNILAFAVIDTAAGGSSIDKSSISLALEKLDPTSQFIITYDVEGTKTDEVVEKGNQPVNVPTPTKKGYVFDGWKVGDTDTVLSSEKVKTDITTDTVLTAQFSLDPDYTQSIATVEFVDPIKTVIKYPAETNARDSKKYTVKVTSDIGADITDDCTFEWEIAGESDDGYVEFDREETETTGASRKLSVRQGGETCLGYIKATATYTKNSNDTPMSVQVPYAVITDTTVDGQILPAAGYPISMDDYKDNMIGYVATSDDLNRGYDLVLNNWCIVGSNPARDLLLVEKDGKKALKFTNTGGNRGGSSSSCVGAAAFPTQSEQYVFETIVSFDGNGRIGVWDKTPNNGGAASEWAISYDGGSIKVGDETISGVSQNEWYKVVVSSDPASKLYSVYVSDLEGNKVGSVEGVTGGAAGKYLCIDSGFPVYINSLRAYKPTTSKVTISSAADVVQVPENASDPAAELGLTALCETADGIKLTGAVTWTLAQEYQGVELVASTENAQQATLKVSNGAAGEIVVNASKDGKTASKTIMLTNSSNVVTFTQSQSSITIPFSGEAAVTAQYKAETIGKDEELPANKTIKYTLMDKTGNVELTTLPKGIKSKVSNNVLTLTVSPGATASVFYIRATDVDGLSTKVQVNVHGLSYTFGTDEVEGDTRVGADTLYTDRLGYGFSDTSALSETATAVSGTAAYKFMVKVPNGNYRVEVSTTSATMQSEIVDKAVELGAALNGIQKSGSNFEVAVCDEILDLTFLKDSSVSKVSISQSAAKEKREKPAIFAVGDSTTKNNDSGNVSWGNCAEMKNVPLPDVFSSFANHGQAGRDSVNFYDQGRIETVLLNVCPGDYVTINMGINARPESGNETAAYPVMMDTYYVKAVLDRGAIPVVLSHTPLGKDRMNYDASTGKFTNVSRTNDGKLQNLLKLAGKYDINMIDVGGHFEEYFSSLTMDDVTAYNEAHGTSFANTGEMVKSWYPTDHNHYAEPLGNLIAEYIFSELEKIEKNPFTVESVTQTAADGKITLTAAVKDGATAGSKTLDAYVAQYDANGALVKIEKTAVTFTNSKLTAEVEYAKDANVAEVRVFVWDDMTPYLSNQYTLVDALVSAQS